MWSYLLCPARIEGPAAPSALGWSIGAAAADPGHVRPRCRAERRAAAPARPAASCGRCGPPGCPGSDAGAPAWSGPTPDLGEIQRGQLRPARIEGTGSVFGGRTGAIGAKISKGGYPFHKTRGLLGVLETVQVLRYGLGLLLIRERSSVGSSGPAWIEGSGNAFGPGMVYRPSPADPGHVRPRCRAERRAAPSARPAASCGRCGPSGCLGCSAGAPAWSGPAPDPGEIQRGRLRF